MYENLTDDDLIALSENRFDDLSDDALLTLTGEGQLTAQQQEVQDYDPINIPLLPDSIERGLARAPYSIDFAAHGLGLKSDEDFATDTAKLAKKLKHLEMSDKAMEQLQEIYGSSSAGEFVKNLVTNPEAVGNLIGESVGAIAGTGAVALGGGKLAVAKGLPVWGARLLAGGVFGAGSGSVEAGTSFFGDLAELTDVNVEDPIQVQEALEDPELVKAMRAKAVERGVPIAAFDALSASVAGIPFKLFTKSGMTRGTVGSGVGSELAIQGATGALGEASAQSLSEGSITDPVDVGLEAALEIITGGPQAALTTLTVDGTQNPLLDAARTAFDSARTNNKKKAPAASFDETIVGDAPVPEVPAELEPSLPLALPEDTAPEKREDQERKVSLLEKAEIAQERIDTTRQEIAQARKTGLVNLPDGKGVPVETSEGRRQIKRLQDRIRNNRRTLREAAKIKPSRTPAEKPKTTTQERVEPSLFDKTIKDYVPVDRTDPNSNLLSLPNLRLPKELRGAKPRYSPGGIQHNLTFDTDVSKALYIASSKQQSKSKGKYHKWLNDLGVTDEEIRTYGKAIREDLRQQTKTATKEKDIKTRLPEQFSTTYTPNTENAQVEDNLVSPTVLQALQDATKLQQPEQVARKVESPTISQDSYLRDIAPRVKAMELTPTAKKQLKPITDELSKIARRVGGANVRPTFAQEAFVLNDVPLPYRDSKTLPGAFYEAAKDARVEAIRGAQYANLTMVALQNKNPTETQYHELWHFLEANGVFNTPKIQQVFERDLAVHADYIANNSDLTQADVVQYMKIPEGREELRATLFGLLGSKWDSEGKVTRGGLTNDSHNIFRKAWDAIKSMFSVIRSNNTSLEDVMMDAFDGKFAVEDLVHSDKIARLQKIQANTQSNTQDYTYDVEQHRKDLKAAIEEGNAGKEVGNWAFKVRSKWGLAKHHPAFAKAYDVAESQKEKAHAYLSKYQRGLEGYFRLPKEQRYAIGNIAAHNKMNKQKAWLDEVGRLHFIRDGKEVRIDDLEASKQYMALQETAKEVLNDSENFFRRKVQKEYRDLKSDFTVADLQKIRDEIESGVRDVKNPDREIDSLDTIVETLNAFSNMRKSDFIPFMRFGKWAVAVYRKHPETGKKELVDFRKIDSGFGKQKYHKQQLEALKAELKDKYSGPEYVITGAGGKKVRNLDSLEPFLATKDEMKNHIDPNILTLDMLAEIMHSDKMDTETYKEYRDTLYNDLTTKGFNTRFAHARDIPGYSQDWDRVLRSYTHGAAHFLSSMEHRPMFNNIAAAAKDITDDAVRKGITDFVQYVQTPQEDLQGLRALNFFWAMGFNASSAVLQYMSLPTITAGQMAQYDGNIIKNQAKIAKWGSYGSLFMKHKAVRITDAGLTLDIENESLWNDIRKKNKQWDDETFTRLKELAIDQHRKGNIGALEMQEYGGSPISGQVTPIERFTNIAAKGVQTSGFMIGFAEQHSRFSTLMAVAEQLMTDPQALARADKVLSTESIYTDRKTRNPNLTLAQHAAIQTLHNSHAVFGKIGRPEVFKGIGGAVIIPFMTWSHQMWGLMHDMAFARGKEGRVGLYTTLTMMFALSGLIGLPGGDLLKELYEELHKAAFGEEIDLDEVIRTAVAQSTGSMGLATFINHGSLRAFGGLDVSRRTGLPVPGQEILLSLLGSRGDQTSLLGVQGSMIGGVGRAWTEYNNQAGAAAVAQEMLPVAMSNVAKAIQYSKEGVRTRGGRSQLVAEEDVTTKMIVSRIFGVTEGRIADQREKQFFAQTLERRHKPTYDKLKRRMENHLTRYVVAKKKGDVRAAQVHMDRYNSALDDMAEWSKEEEYLVPWASVTRSVMDKVQSRLNTDLDVTSYNKAARKDIYERLKKNYE